MREIAFGSRLAELPSHLAGRDVEPGNQGMGAVALILELAALDPSRGHRLRRRCTLKCLYSCHFVNRYRLDSRCLPLRGQTVRLADVVEFLRELGVWFGVQPAATAMRFEVR